MAAKNRRSLNRGDHISRFDCTENESLTAGRGIRVDNSIFLLSIRIYNGWNTVFFRNAVCGLAPLLQKRER